MRSGRVSDPAKVEKYGSHIENESRRLGQIIDNILDFSRIESGEKTYSFELADIEDLLTSILTTYGLRLHERGHELAYSGPEDPLPDLQVDTSAMDRAIENLLDNAIKYSNDASVITVRARRHHDEVIISVADQGIGIPPDELDQVFDRFHRVSTGLVHDVKGSGLGLSLVQHIVEAHGGHVTVVSELGKGSTFTIHLPIESQTGETS